MCYYEDTESSFDCSLKSYSTKIIFIVAHFDGMGDYFFMYFIISKIAIKSKKVIILSIRHPFLLIIRDAGTAAAAHCII